MDRTAKVRSKFYLLAILFATGAMSFAQTGPTGTWRVEGTGYPFPWELVLRGDGPAVRGAVNSCASLPALSEIFEGTIDGNKIEFKCRSGQRTISFSGDLKGDQIEFTWSMQMRTGGIRDPRVDGMFGSSVPQRFTARRVPDGELAAELDKVLNAVPGMEFAGAVNVVEKDLKADSLLFLPQKVTHVRALVVIFFGLGSELLVEPEWRHLTEHLDAGLLGVAFTGIGQNISLGMMNEKDRAEVLVTLLRRLAEDSSHPELADAPLLFWGHSGAAVAAASIAAQLSNRTVALVRYHSGAAQGGDVAVLEKIPALFLSGGMEFNADNPGATETLWNRGRLVGAPWTLAVQPEATHGDPKDLAKANELMIPWITAVLLQRLSPDGKTLRPVADGSAWMGNNQTGEIAPYSTYSGSKANASWLPDEASARGWQIVLGTKK